MAETVAVHPQACAWLKVSALNTHVSGYCAHLDCQRYAPNTKRVYLCAVAHFAHWMGRKQIDFGSAR